MANVSEHLEALYAALELIVPRKEQGNAAYFRALPEAQQERVLELHESIYCYEHDC